MNWVVCSSVVWNDRELICFTIIIIFKSNDGLTFINLAGTRYDSKRWERKESDTSQTEEIFYQLLLSRWFEISLSCSFFFLPCEWKYNNHIQQIHLGTKCEWALNANNRRDARDRHRHSPTKKSECVVSGKTALVTLPVNTDRVLQHCVG